MPTRAGSTVDHRDRAPAATPDDPTGWVRLVRPSRAAAPSLLLVLVHSGATLPRGFDERDDALVWLDPGALPLGDLGASIRRTLDTVDWLIDRARLGHDHGQVVVIGHGAGAHLAATVAVHDPRPAGYVLISGVYDLSDTDRPTARHHSPLSSIGGSDAECIVAWASRDACEVRRQGQAWAATWSVTDWNRPAVAVEVAGRHHDDVVDDLLDPSTTLGDAVLRMLSRIRTT